MAGEGPRKSPKHSRKTSPGKHSEQLLGLGWGGPQEEPKTITQMFPGTLLEPLSLLGWARNHGRTRNSHEKRCWGIILSHFQGLAEGDPRKKPKQSRKTCSGNNSVAPRVENLLIHECIADVLGVCFSQVRGVTSKHRNSWVLRHRVKSVPFLWQSLVV